MFKHKDRANIVFIGGGSEVWAPKLIRDIVLKDSMENVSIDVRLLDSHPGRARAIESLFAAKLKEWKADHAVVRCIDDPREAFSGADFVMIAISTGRLEAMRHDLEIPAKYGIHHTVGDSAGPGGWARTLRNIPVFNDYARQIKELAPDACVLNYTNPMGSLTKVLSDELPRGRVMGLCHGLFSCYDVLKKIFNLESEKEIQVRFGGLNHFFWLLDITINGVDGYKLLKDKTRDKSFAELVKGIHDSVDHFHSDMHLTGELIENYGYMPYCGDRHTCEFFGCYITDRAQMERFRLVQTTIADRKAVCKQAAQIISLWTRGEKADESLDPTCSRETAADIIKAITLNQGFTDVVNMVNVGQIGNLPRGAVVETMGYVDANGARPIAIGDMPESVRSLLQPHTEVQLRTVEAGLAGDLDAALMALAADPLCSRLTISDVKKMGMEMVAANRQYLPQFDI